MLSKRLEMLCGMVTAGHRLADIGTDHAFLPIKLIKDKVIPHAIAIDINEGPLLRAKEHIKQAGLEDYIETRISDGLDKLRADEADTVLIAGMGGRLMIRILSGWEDLSNVREWIFQPQSEIAEFRKYIAQRGLIIEDERMICEDEKYYTMIKCCPGSPYETDALSASFGPVLLARRDATLKACLEKEMASLLVLMESLNQTDSKKAEERTAQLSYKGLLISNAMDILI